MICLKNYDYGNKWQSLLTPEIVGYLTTIHEFRGEQRLIADRHADVLEDLVQIAKIQSTESSNRIEGIYTSDEQLRKLVLDKTKPKSRDEREIAGYRDVLNTIHENYEHIPAICQYMCCYRANTQYRASPSVCQLRPDIACNPVYGDWFCFKCRITAEKILD